MDTTVNHSSNGSGTVEGHVPAADILKLRAQPDLIGAAVPGMPIGSPGMEGGTPEIYEVVLFGADMLDQAVDAAVARRRGNPAMQGHDPLNAGLVAPLQRS